MSGNRVNESGTAKLIGANGSYVVPPGGVIVGILPSISGTVAITDSASNGMVSATAITAGLWAPLPFECPIGATVTLAGGAAGTLAVA